MCTYGARAKVLSVILEETSVLIVESDPELGALWAKHLERQGTCVVIAHDQPSAVTALSSQMFDIIVTDLMLEGGSALAISDFANYRQPDARIIFVTNTTFFSDGSIFQHCSNACAYLPRTTKPDDLAAMVEHYGTPITRGRVAQGSLAEG